MIALECSPRTPTGSALHIYLASIRILRGRYNDYAQLVWRTREHRETKRLGVIDLKSPTALLDVALLAEPILTLDELLCLKRANKSARW